jgi:ATP-binding cassette subfamily C protein
MYCDRIYLVDDGKIVEEGNYEQLMEKQGLFYHLASRQMT